MRVYTHVKSVGFVKIPFEAWTNDVSCNNIIWLLCQEKNVFKEAFFQGKLLPWLRLRSDNGRSIKDSLFLNTFFHDIIKLLHYEHSLQ